ncbi:MAG TPA: PAS domain S-box protein [Smithellaceae bacterium]|nr:PAS domain S-box protein [Smithellaceae bacterium]
MSSQNQHNDSSGESTLGKRNDIGYTTFKKGPEVVSPGAVYWREMNKKTLIKDKNASRISDNDSFYVTITNNLQIGVYLVQNGKIKFTNKHISKYSGYDQGDLLGADITKFVHPQDRQDVHINAIKMLKGLRNVPYEFRIIDKNGKIKWLMESVSSIIYEGKRAVLGNTMEITEIKEARYKLEQLQNLEATILKSVPHALFGVEKRQIFFANDAMERIFGWTKDELIGKSTRILFRSDQEWLDYGTLLYTSLEEQDRLIFEWQMPFVRKDGKEIICRMSVARIGDRLTEQKRIVATFEDVTEIKRAEQALRDSQQRLAEIIEFLPDATFAIDLEGKIIAWNRAAEDLTGVEAKEVLGKKNYEYARAFWKKRRPMAINLVIEPNEKYENTYSMVRRVDNLLIVEAEIPNFGQQNTNVHLWCKASPLYDSNGNVTGAIEVIRDITDRKKAENALIKREQDLEIKSHELEELNTALKVLLKRGGEDRRELEDSILKNVRELVFPYIEELKKKRLDNISTANLTILESNLRNIISPFGQKLSNKFADLTNREVKVADFIKEGKSSKEMAELLCVTESAINIYRYRLRKKMGLKRRDNLKSFLSAID